MRHYIKHFLILLLPALVTAHEGITTGPDEQGVYTYTQVVDALSTEPYYTQPNAHSGFGIYGNKDEDFGWMHTFPDFSNSDKNIISAQLLIKAYDVDAEPYHGLKGEYNQIKIDGNKLNPGFLQGSNNTYHTTTFDIPLNYIKDDGNMNVFLDIDIIRSYWMVTIPKSTVIIKYKIVPDNLAPYKPQLISGTITPSAGTALTVEVSGALLDGVFSDMLDPNIEDTVTYKYRWYVDVGQGEFIDASFAGKGELTTDTVPASLIKVNEKWRVEVTPIDNHGAIGPSNIYTWLPAISKDSDNDGIPDTLDAYPLDSKRAFNAFYPAQDTFNTLLFEDMWPKTSDYDMNDIVMHFNYKFIRNSENKLKDILLSIEFAAYGGIIKHGFGLEIDGINSSNILEAKRTIENTDTNYVKLENGHAGKTVFQVVPDITKLTPIQYNNGNPIFYNTQSTEAERSVVKVTFHITLINAITFDVSKAPFNPFIFRTSSDQNAAKLFRVHETHLIDHVPTALADTTLFGTQDDVSNSAEGKYYRTKTGLPWALEISGKVSHVSEHTDFTKAYQDMAVWAQSNGLSNKSWFNNKQTTHTWKGR